MSRPPEKRSLFPGVKVPAVGKHPPLLIAGPSLFVHIQVIAGAGMDVDFAITSPQGVQLVFESQRSDGVHV